MQLKAQTLLSQPPLHTSICSCHPACLCDASAGAWSPGTAQDLLPSKLKNYAQNASPQRGCRCCWEGPLLLLLLWVQGCAVGSEKVERSLVEGTCWNFRSPCGRSWCCKGQGEAFCEPTGGPRGRSSRKATNACRAGAAGSGCCRRH